MLISEKSLDTITENDLLQLIDHQVSEGVSIDYKRDLYGSSDDDKREALKDVSSFANARGGHIVIGMEEKEGLPTQLVGVEVDADAECLRMESLFRDCIEPRVIGLQNKSIKLASGKCAIVIRIPKSWQAPHRYSYKNTKRFYARHSVSASEASMDELRSMFLGNATLVERARNARHDRVTQISAGELPIPVRGSGQLFVQLVPLAAIEGVTQIDLRRAQEHILLPPLSDGSGYDFKFNVDGFLTHNAMGQDGFVDGYVQLFRDGSLEAISGEVLRGSPPEGPCCYASYIERRILFKIESYLKALRGLAVTPPFLYMTSLLKFKGGQIRRSGHDRRSMNVIQRNEIYLPDILIEDFVSQTALFQLLRPLADTIWNASNVVESPNFDSNGLWHPQED